MSGKTTVRKVYPDAFSWRFPLDWRVLLPPTTVLGSGHSSAQAWEDAALKLRESGQHPKTNEGKS